MNTLKRYTQRLADGIADRWWVADRYVVKNGSIVPTGKASFTTYDPWAGYHEAPTPKQRRSGVVQRPYTSFLTLGADLQGQLKGPTWTEALDLSRDYQITPDGEQAITYWVQQHGLLGLLAAETEFLVLPGKTGRQKVVRPPRAQGFAWDISECLNPNLPDVQKSGMHILKTPNRTIVTPVHAIFLEEYFPGVRDPAKDDSCWTTSFQRQYGEPLYSIGMAARSFLLAALLISSATDSLMASASPLITNLALQATPHFRISGGAIEYEHHSPALLSSYALMVLWDAMEGLSVARCGSEGCEKPFVRNSPRVKWCSERCKVRERTQRYRDRKKQAAKEQIH